MTIISKLLDTPIVNLHTSRYITTNTFVAGVIRIGRTCTRLQDFKEDSGYARHCCTYLMLGLLCGFYEKRIRNRTYARRSGIDPSSSIDQGKQCGTHLPVVHNIRAKVAEKRTYTFPNNQVTCTCYVKESRLTTYNISTVPRHIHISLASLIPILFSIVTSTLEVSLGTTA